MKVIMRERPITVTRGLPFVINCKQRPYNRLLRIAREVDHMWHRGDGYAMLVQQYTSLYNRVYFVPSIANLCTSAGDTAIDEWLARQAEIEG